MQTESENSICPICGNPAYAGHVESLHKEAESKTANPKITIHKEKSPDPQERALAASVRETAEEAVNYYANRAREESVEFSPEMLKFIEEARSWHEQRFKQFGVEGIKWGDHVYKVPRIKEVEGNSGLGITKIGDLSREELITEDNSFERNDFVPIEVPAEVLGGMSREEAAKAVRNYIEAVYISHELYHDAAPTSIRVLTRTDEETGEKSIEFDGNPYERRGVHYIRQTGPMSDAEQDAPALEEGLAMTAQKDSEQLAASMFPEGARLYETLKDYAIFKDTRLNPEVRDYMSIRNFDGRAVKYGPMQYANGYIMTNYLAQEIPDFYKLVEGARINGETVSLARAIEKRFGSGSYRAIVTAKNSNALDVLEELNTKLES
jgi:hypothetical protein